MQQKRAPGASLSLPHDAGPMRFNIVLRVAKVQNENGSGLSLAVVKCDHSLQFVPSPTR